MSLPDGWLTEPEADELRRLAAGRLVLELGAWKGRSTVAMAETAALVVSVDRHQGIGGGEDSLPDYLASVRALPNVLVVVAEFETFVPLLRSVFELVYVDGDHEAEAVERDARLALTAGGDVVAFHDWDFESVRAGAAAVFGREPDGLVGSVAWFS